MTPKEKAKELYHKYIDALNIRDLQITANPTAKQCALIVVKEMISEMSDYYDRYDCLETLKKVHYWEEVKKEILEL